MLSFGLLLVIAAPKLLNYIYEILNNFPILIGYPKLPQSLFYIPYIISF
jgi:hypothetical protein